MITCAVCEYRDLGRIGWLVRRLVAICPLCLYTRGRECERVLREQVAA